MDTGEPSDGAPLVAIQQFLDYSDPQPAYRALLAAGDVAQLAPGLAMAVSRDAVNEAAKHPDVFSSGGIYNLGNVRPLIPLAVDPPGHAKYRKILDPLFAPSGWTRSRTLSARANHFIDEFVDEGGCEYHDEFAVPFLRPSSSS